MSCKKLVGHDIHDLQEFFAQPPSSQLPALVQLRTSLTQNSATHLEEFSMIVRTGFSTNHSLTEIEGRDLDEFTFTIRSNLMGHRILGQFS